MAYPGSQLYAEAIKEGARLPDTWLGFSQYGEDTLPLATKHLTSAEVLRFRDNAFTEYFGSKKYQDMLLKKFGPEALEHVTEMLKVKVKRKYA